jgi:hypothetical protein
LKIDLRILAIVAGCTVVAASAVVLARFAERGQASFLAEKIPPQGAATAEQSSAGLMLQVGAKGISLAWPQCDAKPYQDKFFLHVYPEAGNEKTPTKYINMDFDLAQEKGRELHLGGSKYCVLEKKFPDVPVKQISIGQFTMPAGRCCDISWSRSFLLDASLQKR